MKGKSLAWIFTAALAGTGLSTVAQAQEKFVTIGTGGQTGVYYVAGQSICRFVNRNAENIKCNAPASGGGVANVNGLRSGEFNFGIMQSDHQYKAMGRRRTLRERRKMDDIRAVFSCRAKSSPYWPVAAPTSRGSMTSGQARQHRQPRFRSARHPRRESRAGTSRCSPWPPS